MVISWLVRTLEDETPHSPWAAVEATQRHVTLPCLLVPQPAHAVLAGDIAAALLPDAFGELPAEIVHSIRMHDTGWAASDARQLERLRSSQGAQAVPVSFISIAAAETMEAWTASVESVQGQSKVGAAVVSQHFTRLAQKDQPLHQKFKQAEIARQQRLAGSTLANGQRPGEQQIIQWTEALRFCDLVSLYLLSGLQQETAFPLAHSSVTMQLDGEYLHFTPPVLQAESVLTIAGLKHPAPKQGPRAETLSWEVE